MFDTGLVSITFRKLAPEQIVELVAQAGLEAIEWGGDVHVPHGDLAGARRVRRLTESAGLSVCSYGSYYRAGDDPPGDFDKVLATADGLGAPAIRVWAGRRPSSQVSEEYRRGVVEDSLRIAEQAGRRGIRVAFEFHSGTLTDTNASTGRLLADAGHPNLWCYWQPPRGAGLEECQAGLSVVGRRLLHVHVFAWDTTGARLALEDAKERWKQYLDAMSPIARARPDAPRRFLLLEFVRGDSPEQFLTDAATLNRWRDELAP